MSRHRAAVLAILATALLAKDNFSQASSPDTFGATYESPTWADVEGFTCELGVNNSLKADGSPAPGIDYGVYSTSAVTSDRSRRCEVECQPTVAELNGAHRNCLACAVCSPNSGACQFDYGIVTQGDGCCADGKLGRCAPDATCETSDDSPSCDAAQDFPGLWQESTPTEDLTAEQQEFLNAAGGGMRRGTLAVVAGLVLVVMLS